MLRILFCESPARIPSYPLTIITCVQDFVLCLNADRRKLTSEYVWTGFAPSIFLLLPVATCIGIYVFCSRLHYGYISINQFSIKLPDWGIAVTLNYDGQHQTSLVVLSLMAAVFFAIRFEDH